MKKVTLYIQVIILTIIFHSCSNNNAEIKQEGDIINDIFLQIFSDDQFVFPVFPPPPPPSHKIQDKSNQDSDIILMNLKYKELMSRIDTNRCVFSIEDSTYLPIDSIKIIEKLEENDLNNYIKIFQHSNKNNKKEIPIKIDLIKKTGSYELIYRSKILPKGYDFRKYFKLNLTYYYFGNLMFSKPYLNESNNIGFIVNMQKCGFECDRAYILSIEKTDNVWKLINKIVI
jgi:hypothetical protein